MANTPAMTNASELLAWLPDIPRWVETRSMLLAGEGAILGELPNVVVTDAEGSLISVIGRPPEQLLLTALANALPGADLLATPEDAGHVSASLNRVGTPAVIHRLGEITARPSTNPPATDVVRLLTHDDIGSLGHLPPALAVEIVVALASVPVAAAFVNGLSVSFCYPGSATETLWDVGIDTLAEYRRAGHASRVVLFMVDHMRARGLEPVWCALTTNAGSLAMATKLGFRACDQIYVFEHSPVGLD